MKKTARPFGMQHVVAVPAIKVESGVQAGGVIHTNYVSLPSAANHWRGDHG
jgi:hypothetical protein